MSDQPEKKQDSGNADRRPYGGDRSREGRGKGKPYDGKGEKDRIDKPRGNRKFDDDRTSRGERKFDGDRKPYRKDDGDREPYRKFDGEGKPERKSFDGEKKPYRKFDGEGKPERKFDGEKKPFRKDDGERKPYRKFDGDRKFDKPRGDRRFDAEGRTERRFEDRDNERRFDGERKPPRKPFRKDDADSRADRKFEGDRKPHADRKLEGDRARSHDDKPRRDFKYADNPKDQARKGYQGRKPRNDGHSASPARLAALKVVAELRRRDAFAQELISKHIDDSPLQPEDRAFATKLVLGVVSTSGTLDDALNRCMNNPDDVSDSVRDALRISAYEILFLDKEAHAAVDQGVELVRSVAPKASGVGNAVLRKLVMVKPEFPFGDPQREMGAYARKHAFPEWLARQLLEIYGPDGAHDFMEISNEPAPVFIALNAAKDGEDVIGTLAAAHGNPQQASVDGVEIAGCYKLDNGQPLSDGRIRRLLNNGHLLVSDAASQAVASIVLPDEKPESFLEIGAGRATKTILIQSNALRKWNGQIETYVTLDNHAFKTKLLEERAQAYGINVSEALTGDATNLTEVLGERTFDAVFIDAPCTGLGTLRRHPEIRWRLKPETIDEYATLGLSMLKEAALHVKAGGTLTYATCTVTLAENASVIKAFLESEEGRGFKLVPVNGKSAFASQLTPGGADAHFAAKMVKSLD